MSPPSSTVPRLEGAPKPASYETQREGWAGRRPEGRMDDPYALQKEKRVRERERVVCNQCVLESGRVLCGLSDHKSHKKD